MPIPSGVDQKKSKVYVQKTNGDYLQILPESFCESEILEGSLWPVSSHALKQYSNSIEERIAPFSGATATTVGKIGTVPEAGTADRTKFLRGDGTWVKITSTDEMVKAIKNVSKVFYLTGTDSSGTNIGSVYFDPGVYVSENNGELCATKFKGPLEGNVKGDLDGTAKKANADSHGNNIADTYVTKEEMESAYAAAVHTHKSSDVSSLNGYTKGTSTAAIATSDTLNKALGKLEKRIDGAAQLNSPAFTGTPTTPNLSSTSGDGQIANKKYVDDKVSALIDGAGSAFDTLQEIKLALGGDPDFANTIATNLGKKLDKNSANYVKTLSISSNTSGSGQLLTVQTGNNATYTLSIVDTVCHAGTQDPLPCAATAVVGTSVKYAREDHVHPISGNAATADAAISAQYLATARKLGASLSATDAAYFDGKKDQLNIPVTGILPVQKGGTGAENLNGLVQTGNVNQTISGTKTFSNTIKGSITGNAATANVASKLNGTPTGTTWVAGATSENALVNANTTTYGAILNAPTKTHRIALSTYPSNNDLVYLYSVTNENVTNGTNTVANSLTWNAKTGELTAKSLKVTGTIDGTATLAEAAIADGNGNVIADTYLPLTGGTVTGTLNLTKVTDAQGTVAASPALRIGSLNGTHLEFDGNEIMAKASGTTTGPLYINNDGGQVIIGQGGLKVTGAIQGNLNGNADTATSASKIGTESVGGIKKPIYLDSGEPKASTATVGSATVPIYINNGTLTACTGIATTKVYQGATASANAVAGLVPAATSAKYKNYLRADGNWIDISFTDAVAMTNSTIDLSKGCIFTKTISANTTFTISGMPEGKATTFNLVLTNGGSKTITWPSSVKWTAGTPPSLTASGIDVLTFLTTNGGTVWYGTVAVEGAA